MTTTATAHDACPADESRWKPVQIRALCLSIEHWYDNWKDPEHAEIYSSSCECCQLGRKSIYDTVDCTPCPIAQFTKRNDCVETPWIDVYNSYTKKPWNTSDMQKQMEAEYRFLVKVLLAKKEKNSDA